MKPKNLKLGVIGAGYLGELHIKKLRDMANVQLIGFVDTDPHRARYISQHYKIKAFSGPEDLLSDLDACVVSVPTTLHFEVGKKVLEAGVNLFMEKPLCKEVSEAEELVDMAIKRGLVLQVGHVERFNPALQGLLFKARPPFYFEAKREHPLAPRGLDTDVVMDLMIHDLDILLTMTRDEPTKIRAFGKAMATPHLDLASAWLSFPDGSVACLTASRVAKKAVREIRVIFGQTCYTVDCKDRTSTWTCYSGKDTCSESQEFHGEDIDPLRDELAEFVDALTQGREPKVTGMDGVRALRLAKKIVSLAMDQESSQD